MRCARAHSAGINVGKSAPPLPSCPPWLQHRPRQSAQPLHTSTSRRVKHRSPYRSITQKELQRIANARAQLFAEYSKEEQEAVKHAYTPQQQPAIALGEAAVSPHDLSRGKPRKDFLRPKYIDPHAFSRFQPTIDLRPSTSAGEWDRQDDDAPTKNFDFFPDPKKKIEAIERIMLDPSGEDNEDFVFPSELEDEDANAETKGEDGEQPPATMPPKRVRNLRADLWHMLKTGKKFDKDAPAISEEEGMEEMLYPPQSEEIVDDEDEDEDDDDDYVDDDVEEDLEKAETGTDDFEEQLARALPESVRNRKRTHPLTDAQRFENAIRWREEGGAPELSQEIPKIEDPRWELAEGEQAEDEAEEGGETKSKDDDDAAEAWQRLAKRLGQPVDKLQQHRMKVLVNKNVVNQTRLGKISSAYVLVIVGDERGTIGLGEGKASEILVASRMAHMNAVRNMKPILRYEKRTIYGEVIGKVGAVELKMNARPPGYGLRCSSYAYEIAKCAGLEDLQAKSLRSRNPMNVCKAMVQALQNQRDPDDVARSRGKKLVDVRKVYYAGLV